MTARKTGTLVRCLLLPFTIVLAAMMISGCGGGGSSSDGGGGGPVLPNQLPTVDAGPDQAVTLPATASLDGTVTDDRLPNPPGRVTTTWTLVSGPGKVTFANSRAVDTTASFSGPGTYALRLTANDGGSAASDVVTVSVNGGGGGGAANRPPAVNAGPEQVVTLPAAASLDGTVTDDGLPNPPGAVTTTWTLVSGPGKVTFANPRAVDTTASFSEGGNYVLGLIANDGGVVSSGEVAVAVIASPPQTPNISLLPVQTDFGPVVLDQSSEKNIEIKNTGNADLTIGQIALTNPATNPFGKISDGCSGAVIPPSSGCAVTIRFAPTTQGDYLGSLDVPSNDSDAGLLAGTLTGKGRALNASITRVAMVGPQTLQVIVSVRDRFNAPVTTLAAGNFSVIENGSPKSIQSISNTVKPPVSVGMVLDYSSSMGDYKADVEAAAKSFIGLLDPANDEAEIIKFATDIAVMQSFTKDHALLNAAIDSAFPYQTGSRFYDALDNSIKSISSRSNSQRAIIAVSDGMAAGYTVPLSDVIASAAYNHVQIFTIGIGATDNVTLQTLATETGGQYFYSPTSADLTTVYSTISEILSNEYAIEYTTSSVAGSTISLKVMVDDNGELGEHSITAGI